MSSAPLAAAAAAPAHALALPLGAGFALRLRERQHTGEFFDRLQREQAHLARSFQWMNAWTPAAASAMVERGLAQFAAGDGWQVDLCRDGRAIGGLGLHHLDAPGGSTEIGFWLVEGAQGRGWMTEALRRLLPYFYRIKRLEHVRIGVVPGRGRSGAVVERLGFAPEARLRGAHLMPDGPADLAFFGLRRSAWEAAAAGAAEAEVDPWPPERFGLAVDGELRLRVLEREDAPALQALIEGERERLARYLPWAATQTLAGSERFVVEVALGGLARGDGLHLGVEWRGELRGMVGLHGVRERPRRASLGYWLSAEAEGQGVVARALAALMAKAFVEMGFERLDIRAELDNHRSRAVAERFGFRFEGVLPVAAPSATGFVDHAVYGLLREEWRSSSQGGGSLRTVEG